MIYVNDQPVSMIPKAMATTHSEGLNLPKEQPQEYPPANSYASIRDALLRLGIKATYRAIQSDNFVQDTSGWKLSAEGVGYFAEGNIGGWNINATTIYSDGNEIILDSANKKIESGNYVSGYAGAGFHLSQDLLEVGNIACRGLIRTSVFQKDVISTVGGNLMVLDGDVLDADMDATDAETLTTKATTTFSVGDILRIKDGTDDEWLEVTAVNGAVYTVTRDKKGDYAADTNPTWKKGATVVNYGQSGDGGVYMTASESNAPYFSVFTHAGSPWLTSGAGCLTTRVRIGNLNGFLDENSDVYGIAIGETDYYLKYDPTNHLRIGGSIKATAGSDIPLAYVTEEFTAAENIAQYDAVYMVRAEATTLTPTDDSYVADNQADTNYGSYTNIYISFGSGYLIYGLLKFTITGHSNLENYKVILRLRVSSVESDNATWAIYKVNASWAEGTVTWNNQPANDIATGMKKATFNTTSATSWVEVDVTELFRQWNDGSNYGLIIKEDSGANREIAFFSSEAAEANRPQLIIYDDTHADVGKIKKAKADDPITCMSFVGIATEAITSGNAGKVKTFGKTTASGNSSYPGTGLIISATTAGQLVPQPTTDDQYVVNVGYGRTSGNPTITAFIQPPKLSFRKMGITQPAHYTQSDGSKLQIIYIGFRPTLIKTDGYYSNITNCRGNCNCVGVEDSITQRYKMSHSSSNYMVGTNYIYNDGTRTCKIKFVGENYIVLQWNNTTGVYLDIEAFQ